MRWNLISDLAIILKLYNFNQFYNFQSSADGEHKGPALHIYVLTPLSPGVIRSHRTKIIYSLLGQITARLIIAGSFGSKTCLDLNTVTSKDSTTMQSWGKQQSRIHFRVFTDGRRQGPIETGENSAISQQQWITPTDSNVPLILTSSVYYITPLY